MLLAAQLLAAALLLLVSGPAAAADVASAATARYHRREPTCVLYSSRPGNKLPPGSEVRLSSGSYSCSACVKTCLENALCEGAWHKDMAAGLARIGAPAASRLLLLNEPCTALSPGGLCPLYAQLIRSHGQSTSSPAGSGGYYSRRGGSTRAPKASCALFAGSNADASSALPLATAGRSNYNHHTPFYGKPLLPPGSPMTCGDCMARFLTTPQATTFYFAAIPQPPQQPTKAKILAQHQGSIGAAAAWLCSELASHVSASAVCPQAPAPDDVGGSQASCNNIPTQGAQGCPGDASSVEPGSPIKRVTNPRLARQCNSFCACDVRSGSPTFGSITYVDYCPGGGLTEFNPWTRSCGFKTPASTCGFVTETADRGLLGVCYDPQHNKEYPLNGGSPDGLADAIDADFKQMAAQGIKFARTYYSEYFGIAVAPIAAKYGVQLHLGVFMTDEPWYKDQVSAAAEAVKAHPDTVQAIFVGNENLTPNGGATAEELINRMAGIRAAVAAINGGSVPPVGTVQRINEWLSTSGAADAEKLANAAQVIGVNIYTFFSPENATDPSNVPSFVAQWDLMVKRYRYNATKLRLTETGFPSDGGRANLGNNAYGPSATLAHATTYFNGVVNWLSGGATSGKPAFYFSMYDRREDDNTGGPEAYEKHFGLFTSQRSDKNITTITTTKIATRAPHNILN